MNKYTPTFVFLLLCLIFVLVNMGCSSTTSTTTNKAPIVRVPTKITSHQWEDIKVVYRKKPKRSSKQLGNRHSSWGYEYVVTLNKKSWK